MCSSCREPECARLTTRILVHSQLLKCMILEPIAALVEIFRLMGRKETNFVVNESFSKFKAHTPGDFRLEHAQFVDGCSLLIRSAHAADSVCCFFEGAGGGVDGEDQHGDEEMDRSDRPNAPVGSRQ